MTALTPAECLIRVGGAVGEAITPFLATNAPEEGELASWLRVFEAEDETNGVSRRRDISDVRVLLQIFTRHWKLFRHSSTPLQTAWAKDLLRALNTAAHVPGELSEFDAAYHAGVARKLVASLNAPDEYRQRIEFMARSATSSSATQDEIASTATEGPTTAELAADVLSPTTTQGIHASDDADGSRIESQQLDIDSQLMGNGHGLASLTQEIGNARITLVYRKAVNFALVHNGVSPLAGIGIINTNPDESLKIDSLRMSLASLARESVDADHDTTHFDTHEWLGPTVDVPPSDFAVLDGPTLAWELPAHRFIDIDEATADTLECDIATAEDSRRISLPVRILAHDEWNAATVPELLAAFIRPRSAAVGQVLSAASDILAGETGDPSLVGYQQGEDRVRTTVKAIYTALCDTAIRYSEPPASFESTGQKIRTHDTVVESRFGTCIDLSLLYAAALEEAGLNPVLVLFPGHAYAGVFLSDVSASSFVVSDSRQLGNLFGGDLMLPVETTGFTSGSALSFDESVGRAYTRAAHGRAVTYVLDVRAAHRRVRPLPRVTGASGARVIEKVVTAAAPRKRNIGTRREEGQQRAAVTFPARVQRWRSDLLDLSLRNPLLKLSDSRGLQLLVPSRTLGEFEDRLNSNQPIRLLPHRDLSAIHIGRGLTSARELPEEEREAVFLDENAVYAFSPRYHVRQRLTSLRRDARTAKEETGANSLFLTLGSFRWKDRSGTKEGRAPLYLLPVRLTGSSSRPYEVSLEPGAAVQPNYCLIEKLRQEHNLILDVLERPYEDESGIDIARILTELRDGFVSRGLDFSVDERVQLAILQFSTLDLWRDISENWQELSESAIVGHLIDRPGEEFDDPATDPTPAPTDEVEAYLPVAADGSQLEAVRAATAGRSFVMEGPPGTGKSQTITNMIADGLAAGRTILFVAEKQAALAVVHDRLQRIGLDSLVLNVHGQTQTLNTVREQLREAIAEERSGNRDAFDILRTRLREHVEDLSRYPSELHSDEAGSSIWALYQRCLQLETDPPAPNGWIAEEIDIDAATLAVDATKLDSLVRDVVTATRAAGGKRLAPEWHFIVTGGPEHQAVSGHGDHVENMTAIINASLRLADAVYSMPSDLAALHEQLGGFRDALREWLAALPSQRAILPSQLGQVGPDPDALARVRQELSDFHARWSPLAAILVPAAHHADLGRIREQYRESQMAGILKRKKLQRLAEEEIGALVIQGQSSHVLREPLRFLADVAAFQEDERTIAARVEHFIGQAPMATSDPRLDRALADKEAEAVEYPRQQALVRTLIEATPGAEELLERVVKSDVRRAVSGALLSDIDRFEAAWHDFLASSGATSESVGRWLNGQSVQSRIAESASVWRAHGGARVNAETSRLVHLHTLLEQLRTVGLTTVAEQIAEGRSAKGLKAALELAMARRRLHDSLQRTGLDTLDDEWHAEAVTSYLRTAAQLKSRMKNELPAQLLSSPGRRAAVTPQLRKEVDRRRGGSIRSLFSQHGKNILSVTPCILMSPSSVAKFLPPEAVHFDTVIFDEASQIRVADAISALGRGEAAVVAGDSKQMPPTSMFSTGEGRNGEDAEPGSETDGALLAVADQESILSEAVGSGFEQKWLSWHYRSQDESLIAFSNTRYYRGKLSVFPSPPEERPGFGITAEFVGGSFDRGGTRTNRMEADAIVEAIRNRVLRNADVSLGVITFNTEQRDLILDLLEQSAEEAVRAALIRENEPLFVKNLENVQGDERDVILFSLAFSRDPETGRLPLNFGPLNRAGGERRLNVAITRARAAVTLFSSFRSTDIDLNRTSADGIKHLKDYLWHAEQRHTIDVVRRGDDYNLYRERIASALVEVGLEVIPDVGTSKFRVDLAVRASPGHGWLAVTLDSPEWAARAIVADREALPSTILQDAMGWQGTLQVLLPVWVRDPGHVIEQIRAAALALEHLGQPDAAALTGVSSNTTHEPAGVELTGPDVGVISEADDETVVPLAPLSLRTATGVEASAASPTPVTDRSGAYDYEEASTEVIGERAVLDHLDSPKVRSQIAEQLDGIIAVEGPIEATRLARVLAKRFDLNRVRQARVEAILASTTRPPEHTGEFGRFYWPDDVQIEHYTGYRPRVEAGAVAVDEISHHEIANALAAILRDQGEQAQEELIREVAGVFGYNRLGGRIRERFDAVIGWAEKSGHVVRTEGALLAAGNTGDMGSA